MRVVIVAVVLLTAFSLWSNADQKRMLGYHHDGVDGDLAILDIDKGVAVDPDVTGYRVIGNYIIGMRVAAAYPVEEWEMSPSYGYFVFNMVTGELEEGMCWHELVSNLVGKGVAINSLDRFIIDYL